MIAAIYARKSTDQSAIVDDQKSVTRQVESARAFAVRKGWMVNEASIFVDDGISGAEFANRPGFLRLMNTLKPGCPPFNVLIMSEVSRLGREQIETAYAMKQLSVAGVRCFSYLEDRELLIESATDKFLLGAVTFAADLEREKARQRTYDTMARKARAGHVTGGRTFGYENVTVLSATGARSHVDRRILDQEAAVVRQIFELAATGKGLRAIVDVLNIAGSPSPRAQQGRPNGWAPSSVREVLHRELYRGAIVWNRTRKRDQWGVKRQQDRSIAEHMAVAAPHLRIVSDELWQQAHARIESTRRTYLSGTDGQLWGRPANGQESKYLLTGLSRCGACGASLVVRSRSHRTRRAFFYVCSAFHRRGRAICANSLEMPLFEADNAVLTALEQQLLGDGILTEVVQRAVSRRQAPTDPDAKAERLLALRAQLAPLQGELETLMAALLVGGDAVTIVGALRAREQRAAAIRNEITQLERPSRPAPDPLILEGQLMAKLTEWRTRLRTHVPVARQMLRKLIVGRINFTPDVAERRYRFSIPGTLALFFNGLGHPHAVASPTLPTWNELSEWLGTVKPLMVQQARKRELGDFSTNSHPARARRQHAV